MPAGTQNPKAAPSSSLQQRWFEDLTKVGKSNAAEKFGAFQAKKALSQQLFNLPELSNAGNHTHVQRDKCFAVVI